MILFYIIAFYAGLPFEIKYKSNIETRNELIELIPLNALLEM